MRVEDQNSMKNTLFKPLFLTLLALGACRSTEVVEPDWPSSFPNSTKGYTLYGWDRDGEAWFTLITDTNRLKTFDELDLDVPLLGDDGFVRIRVQGVELASRLLARVPDQDVFVTGLDTQTLAEYSIPADARELDPALLASLRGSGALARR